MYLEWQLRNRSLINTWKADDLKAKYYILKTSLLKFCIDEHQARKYSTCFNEGNNFLNIKRELLFSWYCSIYAAWFSFNYVVTFNIKYILIYSLDIAYSVNNAVFITHKPYFKINHLEIFFITVSLVCMIRENV